MDPGQTVHVTIELFKKLDTVAPFLEHNCTDSGFRPPHQCNMAASIHGMIWLHFRKVGESGGVLSMIYIVFVSDPSLTDPVCFHIRPPCRHISKNGIKKSLLFRCFALWDMVGKVHWSRAYCFWINITFRYFSLPAEFAFVCILLLYVCNCVVYYSTTSIVGVVKTACVVSCLSASLSLYPVLSGSPFSLCFGSFFFVWSLDFAFNFSSWFVYLLCVLQLKGGVRVTNWIRLIQDKSELPLKFRGPPVRW